MPPDTLPPPMPGDALFAEELLRLVEAAGRASEQAYCPYSGFRVGAAVLTQAGDIFTGCNVENASYGLTMCAERVTVFKAVSAGALTIRAIAIYTPTARPTAPCGACRQVLFEFAPTGMVVCVCDGPETLTTHVATLLPEAFGPRSLGGDRPS